MTDRENIFIMRAAAREIVEYVDPRGRVPFRRWFEGVKDRKAAAIIDARLTRIQVGNFGDEKSVGTGVKELKIDYGPGYRVYFGEDDRKVVVLLIGGTKKSQSTDIKRAQRYWAEYMET
jgi:putative addiction module killer protein